MRKTGDNSSKWMRGHSHNMGKHRFFYSIFFVLNGIFPVQAEYRETEIGIYEASLNDFDSNNKNSKIVSLQKAAQLVVQSHPRVAQARGYETREAEMIDVAKAAYYPQISGGLASRYDREPSGRYDTKQIQSFDLNVSQMIYDFGKTSSSVRRAEYGSLGAQAQTDLTVEQLIHTATSTVIFVALSQKMIELAKEQVQEVKSLGNLVDKRYKKGASNLSDVLQVKSRLDSVQSQELDAIAQHQRQLKELGLLINFPTLIGVSLDGMPPFLEQMCTRPPNWEQIPDFMIAEMEAAQALAELDLAKAQELPTISLQGNASRALNATPNYGSRLDTGVSLNLSMPFYQGGGLSASKRAAAGSVQAAAARKDEVRLEVSQLLSEVDIRRQNMMQRQNLLTQRVENIKGTKDLYKKQYLDLGTRSLVDLLNAEQEYHQAKVEVVNNELDLLLTQLDCAYYQGLLRQEFNISYLN